MKAILNRQNGTALVSTLLVAPLLVTLVLMFAVTWILTSQLRKQNQLCYEWTLQIQARQAEHLNQLLALNPQVKTLRVALKKAETLLRIAKLSGQPGAILAAQAQKIAIESQLQILRLEQKNILSKAKLEITKDLAKLHLALKKSGAQSQVSSAPQGLPVTPDSPEQRYPTYRVISDYQAQQKLQVDWTWKVSTSLLPWLKAVDVDSQYIAHSCASNINKRNQKWKSEIRPAKS